MLSFVAAGAPIPAAFPMGLDRSLIGKRGSTDSGMRAYGQIRDLARRMGVHAPELRIYARRMLAKRLKRRLRLAVAWLFPRLDLFPHALNRPLPRWRRKDLAPRPHPVRDVHPPPTASGASRGRGPRGPVSKPSSR
jgi:hypothetical protein